MDILISSNLERLLYDLSGSDDKYIKSLMDELKQNGKYQVNTDILAKLKAEFGSGYASDEETSQVIKKSLGGRKIFTRSSYSCRIQSNA